MGRSNYSEYTYIDYFTVAKEELAHAGKDSAVVVEIKQEAHASAREATSLVILSCLVGAVFVAFLGFDRSAHVDACTSFHFLCNSSC